jgi:hypothetical protein
MEIPLPGKDRKHTSYDRGRPSLIQRIISKSNVISETATPIQKLNGRYTNSTMDTPAGNATARKL